MINKLCTETFGLKNPEEFMTKLKHKTEKNPNLTIIASTGNVAFLIIRLMLLFMESRRLDRLKEVSIKKK